MMNSIQRLLGRHARRETSSERPYCSSTTSSASGPDRTSSRFEETPSQHILDCAEHDHTVDRDLAQGFGRPRALRHTRYVPGYEGHLEDFDGGYTVAFERYTDDADLAPAYVGLADDRCQCEHGGYVLTGAVTVRSATGEETFETGDAYYVPAGHTPVLTQGTEVIEFSPTIEQPGVAVELRRTLEVVTKNMEGTGT